MATFDRCTRVSSPRLPPPVKYRVTAAGHSLTRPYAARARFDNRHLEERERATMLQAVWERALGTRTWSVGGGYTRLDLDPDIDGAAPGGTIERLSDGPPLALAESGEIAQQQWTLTSTLAAAPRLWLGRDHALRLGASFGRASAVIHPVAQPAFAELVNGRPARVWDVGYVGPDSRRSAIAIHGFVSDRMSLTPGLTLDAGVRFEYDSGSAAQASNGIRWTHLSPRLSARWRPTAEGSFAVTSSFSRYHHRLLLNYFSVGDPGGPSGSVYRWDDLNADRQFDGSELVLLAPVGACCANAQPNTIDPDLSRPSTSEFLAGVEHAIGSWRWRFTALDRREHHLIALVNTGVTAQDYSVSFVEDPGVDLANSNLRLVPIYNRSVESFGRDSYVLMNAGEASRYQGLDLSIDRAMRGRWSVYFGATAYRSEGTGASRGYRVLENDQGVLGEVFLTPNAETSAYGRLFFDRAYVVKLSGSYRAPGDVRLAAAARYQDGQPFSRVLVAEQLNQGPEIIMAYPRGGQRFTYTLTVDAKIDKDVAVGRGRVGVALEAFNLLNTTNEVEEDVVTGPSFRTTTAVQPPRAIRLGVRVAF